MTPRFSLTGTAVHARVAPFQVIVLGLALVGCTSQSTRAPQTTTTAPSPPSSSSPATSPPSQECQPATPRPTRARIGVAPVAASPTTVSATAKADDFVDSVGVGIHLPYLDTAYGDYVRVAEVLQQAGIRHVRDGWTTDESLNDRLRYLSCQGIGVNLIMGSEADLAATSPAQSARQFVSSLAQRPPVLLDSVEGPNEYDLSKDPDWRDHLREHQSALMQAMRGENETRDVPVLAPSIVQSENRERLGRVPADFGNMHSYTGGAQETTSHVKSELSEAAKIAGSAPSMSTETGYNTAVQNKDGQPGVPEAVAATYALRQLLENFRNGVVRTYIYELLDEGVDAKRSEANYGLLRADFSAKPSWTALRNLISLLRDEGDAFEPQAVDVTVTEGDGKDLRVVPLQKRDGSTYLAVWREVKLYDEHAHHERLVTSRKVTLSVAGKLGFRERVSPVTSTVPVADSGTNSTTFMLGAEVLLLRVA